MSVLEWWIFTHRTNLKFKDPYEPCYMYEGYYINASEKFEFFSRKKEKMQTTLNQILWINKHQPPSLIISVRAFCKPIFQCTVDLKKSYLTYSASKEKNVLNIVIT